MTRLAFTAVRGMAPGLSGKALQNNQATEARNCRLDMGDIRPWAEPKVEHNPAKWSAAPAIATIYKYDPGSGPYWLHWSGDVSVAQGPIADDAYERLYYTINDDDAIPPRVTNDTLVGGASGEYPVNFYTLGVPAPGAAPSVSVNSGSGSSCDAADQESTVYVYTYVTGWGEEGPPSDPSSVVDRCDEDTVNLSNMETGPTSGRFTNTNLTLKRIYRAVTGADGTDYLFVDEIAIANSSYDDTVDTAQLGEVLPSLEWSPPPEKMKGIVALPNGIMVGFEGQDLWVSEPYLPHAWRRSSTVSYPIVGLGAFGTTVVVCTEGHPYIFQGTTPESMTAQEIEQPQSCVSRRGIVSTAFGVIYPSPDGLVQVSGEGAKLLTEGVIDRETWQGLDPGTLIAAWHENLYFGFTTNDTKDGFVFDPRDGTFVWLDFQAVAAYTDLSDDTLYLVQDGGTNDGSIVAWNRGSSNLTAKWRSKPFVMPPQNFGAGRVLADSYGTMPTLHLYGDGSTIYSASSLSADAFRLPAGDVHREYQVEMETDVVVSETVIASTMGELDG